MSYLKSTLAAASIVLSAGAYAQLPQLDQTFVGVSWGESTARFDRSSELKQSERSARFNHVIRNSGTWSARGGAGVGDYARVYLNYDSVSDTYAHRWKTRHQGLTASYDVLLPVAPDTRLFAGGSLGLTKLSLKSRGIRRDTDYGYAAGLQAGVLQNIGDNLQIEGGYRYSLHNAKVDVRTHERGKVGSVELDHFRLAYVGLNYRF